MARVIKGKLLKKINVFGKEYKIISVKDLRDEKGQLIDGLHDPIGNIYIDSSCKEKDFWHTLFHELGHARDSRLSLLQTDIHDDIFEILTDTFATLIVELFDVSWKQ